MGDLITDNARRAVGALLPEGVGVDVELVWDPPWTPDMMSESAKHTFGWPIGLSVSQDRGGATSDDRNEHRRSGWRVPLLVLAFASLFLGMAAGLARLGWSFVSGRGIGALHGPLMASGFFGTVISLERAVALARRWAYYVGPL